ncbi:uncharacterized protein LOC114519125 [Dendronephthya gigantea]|uniref:uncharacterized protein LOC114519125 n=1 Tax=Dendronephthya gigantea TaxID=151771 RepID=UPI00106AE55E|nr:uncharacterized protein LOC114519125 [Dendronephthya gigantea]
MSEPEPSYEPKPKYEPEPKYEPSPEFGEPESEWLSYPNAEPQVDLSTANEALRTAFKVHWIFFAICFSLIVLYNGYQLYKTYKRSRMANRSYISIVQTLVILLGVTRVLALSISPYELISNTPKRVPYVILRLLFAFGFPCLFSGFTFVHKIFLNVSKVQVISRNVLGNKLVAVVLILHFIAVLSSEIITSYVSGTEFLLVICAFYYFTGCLGIATSLLFSGRRVVVRMRKVQMNLSKMKPTGMKTGESSPPGIIPKDKAVEATAKVIRITVLAAVFGFLCALLYIYNIVWAIRASIGDTAKPEARTWLTVNTFLRLFELFLAATMSYAVGSGYQRDAHSKINVSRCDDTVTTTPQS